MSTIYWSIEGIGIIAEEILPHINNKKLAKVLLRKYPEDDNLLIMVKNDDYDALQVDEYIGSNLCDNLADLLTFCDDTDSFAWANDGECNYYLYYPPSMPWKRKENEPKSVEEVHKRIINAVQKITDMTEGEIEKMIDDELYVIAYG